MDNTSRKHYLIMRRTVGFICMFMFPISQLLVKFFCVPGINFPNAPEMVVKCWNNISSNCYSNAATFAIACLGIMAFAFITFPGYDLLDNIFYKIMSVTLILNMAFSNWGKYDPALFTYRGIFPINPVISDKLHVITGTILFSMLALSCLWLFPKHEAGHEISERKALRNKIYITSGIMAFIGLFFCFAFRIAAAFHIEVFVKLTQWKWTSPISEYLIFTPVGLSWLIKGEAIGLLNDEK